MNIIAQFIYTHILYKIFAELSFFKREPMDV